MEWHHTLTFRSTFKGMGVTPKYILIPTPAPTIERTLCIDLTASQPPRPHASCVNLYWRLSVLQEVAIKIETIESTCASTLKSTKHSFNAI